MESSAIKSELFWLQLKIKNPKYVHAKLIFSSTLLQAFLPYKIYCMTYEFIIFHISSRSNELDLNESIPHIILSLSLSLSL
jgi:hypothetical protein